MPGVKSRIELDIQQIGVDLQCAVGIVCQNLLSQHLTQLNTFLVEAVQIPAEAVRKRCCTDHGFCLRQG